MWKSPLPPVRLVRVLAYSSISAIGTWAMMTVADPRFSLVWTRPRRLEMSPMMSPTCSSGTAISAFITGSSRVGLACSTAALKPNDAASLNAISFESTEWCLPSTQRTRMSTTG